MKKILLLTLIAILSAPLTTMADVAKWGEQLPYHKYEFGRVKKSELRQTSYQIDADASAVVIYELRDVFFLSNYGNVEALGVKSRHFLVEETVTRRVKILSEEGKKYSHVKIPFNSDIASTDSHCGFAGVKAYSYTLDGNRKQVVKLDVNNIKLNRLDDKTMQAEFIIPNVEVGTIIEYEYKIKSVTLKPDVKRGFELSSDLPTLHSVCQVWYHDTVWDISTINDNYMNHTASNGYREMGPTYAAFGGTSERQTLRGVDFTAERDVLRNNNYMTSYVVAHSSGSFDRTPCKIEIYEVKNLKPNNGPTPTITVKLKQLTM